MRHLIKQPLSADEIRKLAAKLGGPRELVAPKRRKEAGDLDGEKLITWLAADPGRLRRPIVIVGQKATVGFDPKAREKLAKLF